MARSVVVSQASTFRYLGWADDVVADVADDSTETEKNGSNVGGLAFRGTSHRGGDHHVANLARRCIALQSFDGG